ncbi:HNH endonuclease family protein [Microbacterium sp.]|uniref:HNH endonuclease family protein n=1 Tax=Microbacterium sp. TaxID=51671 RepID=UPI003C74D561
MRGGAWLLIVVVAVIALISGAVGGAQNPNAEPAAAPTASARSSAPSTVSPTPLDAAPTAAPQPPPTETPSAAPTASADSALALLKTLPVKGRAPKTGYERAQFGPRWKDVDRNGCDTRNDILAAQLTDITRRGRCVVLSGTLHDPYSGSTIPFVRGQDTSQLVQIDHVVALSDAWQKGAQALTPEQRTAFANDPLNLLAVDGSANAAKRDGDAATWLPKTKGFRCAYVARQVAVKAAYDLWVTQAEHDAIAQILATCPAQPAPAR